MIAISFSTSPNGKVFSWISALQNMRTLQIWRGVHALRHTGNMTMQMISSGYHDLLERDPDISNMINGISP
jgi:hypothetical protein